MTDTAPFDGRGNLLSYVTYWQETQPGFDPTLRHRVLTDPAIHEAALAWIVEGARRWYAADKVLPPPPVEVKKATSQWKHDSNYAARFIEEMLEPDPDAAVRAADVFKLFTAWAASNGMRPWVDRRFWQRARAHEYFTNGIAEKADGSVRTAGWTIYLATGQTEPQPKPSERLVTGVRFTADAADLVDRMP